jgi:hypothetical protein
MKMMVILGMIDENFLNLSENDFGMMVEYSNVKKLTKMRMKFYSFQYVPTIDNVLSKLKRLVNETYRVSSLMEILLNVRGIE